MKKLGLLATLAMCVTIGGVYATWNYADTTANLSVDQQAVAGLTGMGTTTGESLKIKNGSNSLAFKIDDSNGDHKADKIEANGSITVVYDVAETNNEVATIYCNVTVTSTDGKEYLVTTLEKNSLTKTQTLTGQDVEWTVNAGDLGIAFGADGYFSLPTKADYVAFAASFGSIVTINVHFSLNPIA